MKTLTRDELEAEVVQLRKLLEQAGIDARLIRGQQAKREATHVADIAVSRAETVAARADVQVARDATRLAQANLADADALVAELRASQARLNTVIETVPVGIMLAEAPSGRITMGNGRTEDVLGHPPIYATGSAGYAAYTGFHADGRPVLASEWPLARVITGAVDQAELEVHYQRPDGSRTWIVVNGEAIKADDGTTLGAVVAFRSIDDRKTAEVAQDLLNRELSHRLKNTLAMVQSIATQTLRNAPSLAAAHEGLSARLLALGKAHDVLLAGPSESANVSSIVQGALSLHEDKAERFQLSGPSLFIGPSAALMLGLVLHELATNAAKYGALTNAAGRIIVNWCVIGEGKTADFRLEWSEHDGPPVTPPARKGFGSRLIERGLGGGRVEMTYPPEGATCTLMVPLAGFQFRD
ncbi:sensor histidine kinase [Methylorubrum sp. DB1722]|uniref:sensor histidine kinase n=1 Tax=Methylorubrum sp. DB1722 TaxID=2478916 RepID=UPI0018E3B6D9|nr:HWE histidine kinase domain-containing protein [Methylorubrum sp. DB1722]MBI1689654.1 PAS domain S-box protein [Methylorubrum sp. DB1722]